MQRHGRLLLALILTCSCLTPAASYGEATGKLPKVRNADIPFYPWIPRAAYIQGTVELRVSNDGEKAAEVVVLRNVVGYYSLAPGSISRKEATARAGKSAPEPIPIILLARLAVDQREQGQGIGSALLKDALLRAYAGAEIIGGRAVLVHAIDDEAAAFYRKYGLRAAREWNCTLCC